jgi:hypothetical protein
LTVSKRWRSYRFNAIAGGRGEGKVEIFEGGASREVLGKEISFDVENRVALTRLFMCLEKLSPDA